jgi:serine/threonine-protein kinase
LERGSTVTLVPSLGPPPVDVPSIEGKTLQKARQLLIDAGFTLGAQSRAFSDTVPEGSIIDAPAGMKPKGSAIDVVISKGPPPADVPKVAGMTQDDATAALQELGFVVAVETDFSNKVDRGSVLTVEPKAGLTRPYGSTVTITVSQGPETFPAPSFTGLNKADAEARAADYGLEVSWFIVPGSSGALVIGQNPGSGNTVTYGDTIVLYLA